MMRGIADRRFACIAVLMLGTVAAADDAYPSRPVTLIVPAAAGGGFDLFGRQLGKRLAGRWKQPLVVDNRGGGAGNIAATMVMNARPDGYTLLIWNDALLINPSLFATARYKPQRDFTAISLPLFVPNVIVASKASGLKDVADLIRAAKAGRSLSYGSPGAGTPAHLGTELLQQLAGITLTHIPYRGAAPAVSDVVGDHIPLAVVAVPSAIAQIRSGGVVPLAVTSSTRLEALPEVPTLKESGLPDYRIDTFFALLGPAGMAEAIVQRLEADIAEAMSDPEFHRQLVDQGFQPASGGSKLLKDVIDRDFPVWENLVRKTGIKPE
jgi:tripartite-type tricarboxylate transporter receptor subunit TctC